VRRVGAQVAPLADSILALMICVDGLYGQRPGHCLKQLIFMASWVLWPLLAAWVVWAWRHRRTWAASAWFAWALPLSLLVVAIDMRFVERQRIVVRETTLELGFEARIAHIADLHLGLFKDEHFAARVVERLNTLDVDAVLVSGDWTYEPTRPLEELLAPFAKLRHPTLSVPGNHDEPSATGPARIAEPLRRALIDVGIVPIEYTHRRMATFTVVGLGDHWAGKDDLGPLNRAPKDLPIVLLLHQPDSVMSYPKGSAVLALAGHTHGGQVRLPIVGAVINASRFPFDRGLHGFTPLPTFVTAGLGEVGLPIRWLNPPVIDVLTIR
jgi:uncharacterized protein